MQVLRVGDLVAHKHYPENAIGKISKFYDSGRVGVDDGCRPRNFLPGSLLLWHGTSEPVAPISPGEVEEVEDAIAFPEVMELLPVPRDFIPEQMPEWWERPALPNMENPDCPIGDDEDDWQYVLEFEFFFRAQYRGWLIEMNDEKIYATEPSSKKCWWCECDLDLDGQDGQIAIAQEFIDSWYFAQPSPGQLSLNIVEAVARDPPPPQLRLTA